MIRRTGLSRIALLGTCLALAAGSFVACKKPEKKPAAADGSGGETLDASAPLDTRILTCDAKPSTQECAEDAFNAVTCQVSVDGKTFNKVMSPKTCDLSQAFDQFFQHLCSEGVKEVGPEASQGLDCILRVSAESELPACRAEKANSPALVSGVLYVCDDAGKWSKSQTAPEATSTPAL